MSFLDTPSWLMPLANNNNVKTVLYGLHYCYLFETFHPKVNLGKPSNFQPTHDLDLYQTFERSQ